MDTDAYSERRYVREDFVDAFRNAAAAEAKAEHAYFEAMDASQAAKRALIKEIEAVARGRVRRAHVEWFNYNGDKRGAFRRQIEDAFKTIRYELWVTLFPRDHAADGWLETYPPFTLPRRRRAEDEETPAAREEHAAQWKERMARHEAAMLAEENDPERRNRAIWARERLTAIEADPRVQAAEAARERAYAAYQATHGDVERDAWIATTNDPALKAKQDAWRELHEAQDALTLEVRCRECSKTERITRSERGSRRAPYTMDFGSDDRLSVAYICASCDSAARREKLRQGRAARQMAQRMAQLKNTLDSDGGNADDEKDSAPE